MLFVSLYTYRGHFVGLIFIAKLYLNVHRNREKIIIIVILKVIVTICESKYHHLIIELICDLQSRIPAPEDFRDEFKGEPE